jgi:NitT/TauT family transport system substrate-binding protein
VPVTQELRARNVGHVIVNSSVDRPWSQYFCCMLTMNAHYARQYPIATKRVLRAIMKATDLCREDPQLAARTLVDQGFAESYDIALQTLTELNYGVWREFDPEDTVRFYSLRMHELGMMASTPNEVIARNTDWRFLDEVRRELKA